MSPQPLSSSHWTWEAEAQVVPEVLKVPLQERFGEDIHSVLWRVNVNDFELAEVNKVPGGMVFDMKMSDSHVPALVLC